MIGAAMLMILRSVDLVMIGLKLAHCWLDVKVESVDYFGINIARKT